MGANIAGIYGAQIFRADDKPRYRRGFSIGLGVLAAGTSFAIIRYVDDKLRRRRIAVSEAHRFEQQLDGTLGSDEIPIETSVSVVAFKK